ncbi:MAG: Trk system potassium transporter TrkA [Flavobacteriales bacterium]|jgi:trk system potassium uptake protein TrkA|nr:Trk system potassium transporter TrkA [Flavobacteriales bacterium]MDG1797382.1 Trk system potassium transporter TrkA [Flavobacteriales bacterium]
MKIIIAGAGDVGSHLAKLLSSESHDIYLIDENEERLSAVSSQTDVFTITGDAKSVELMDRKLISSSDLLIAVTSSEETNMLICILGKRLGAKHTIARINDENIVKENKEHFYIDLGIDTLISPTHLATLEIDRLINQAAFTDDIEFENGKLTVFGISLSKNSVLNDKSVRESAELNPNLSFKPLALHRDDFTLMVDGDTVLKENDIVYFISQKESIEVIIKLCGKTNIQINDVMIIGGSKIGLNIASLLEKNHRVTLIEKDKSKCEQIASLLKKTLVININGHDVKTLEEEGLAEMDALISVTANSEMNVMTSLVGKNHGIKKTIARIENFDYINLSQSIGVDTIINKKIIAADKIFKFVRKGNVSSVANLHGTNAEIIEFVVKANTKITKKSINKLNFPPNSNIAGVIRDGVPIIPFGDFQLMENDKTIVFSLTESIKEIEKFFQ